MENTKLLNRIAHLESLNDQLEAELVYIDTLMRNLGFSDGLQTVKATACEILTEKKPSKKKRQ